MPVVDFSANKNNGKQKIVSHSVEAPGGIEVECETGFFEPEEKVHAAPTVHAIVQERALNIMEGYKNEGSGWIPNFKTVITNKMCDVLASLYKEVDEYFNTRMDAHLALTDNGIKQIVVDLKAVIAKRDSKIIQLMQEKYMLEQEVIKLKEENQQLLDESAGESL